MPSGLYTKQFFISTDNLCKLYQYVLNGFLLSPLIYCLHCNEIEIIQTIYTLWCISRRTMITVIYCVYNQ